MVFVGSTDKRSNISNFQVFYNECTSSIFFIYYDSKSNKNIITSHFNVEILFKFCENIIDYVSVA